MLTRCEEKGYDSNPWFSEITFFSGLALWSLQTEKRSLMWCLFFNADFLTFFILANKISRFAKFWIQIQNLNSVAVWEIPYSNRRYDFVKFSRDFGQNARTSSLCTDLKNDAFWISTVVLWTRKTKMSLHNINSWISSILEILACIFFPMNSCNVNLIWIISFKENLNITLTEFNHRYNLSNIKYNFK